MKREDLKLKASENMSDYENGGGRRTGTDIVSGEVNNVFDDISRLDRVNGRFSVRMVYPHVDTADTTKLLGSHVIITDPPEDPYVSVSMMKVAQGLTRKEFGNEFNGVYEPNELTTTVIDGAYGVDKGTTTLRVRMTTRGFAPPSSGIYVADVNGTYAVFEIQGNPIEFATEKYLVPIAEPFPMDIPTGNDVPVYTTKIATSRRVYSATTLTAPVSGGAAYSCTVAGTEVAVVPATQQTASASLPVLGAPSGVARAPNTPMTGEGLTIQGGASVVLQGPIVPGTFRAQFNIHDASTADHDGRLYLRVGADEVELQVDAITGTITNLTTDDVYIATYIYMLGTAVTHGYVSYPVDATSPTTLPSIPVVHKYFIDLGPSTRLTPNSRSDMEFGKAGSFIIEDDRVIPVGFHGGYNAVLYYVPSDKTDLGVVYRFLSASGNILADTISVSVSNDGVTRTIRFNSAGGKASGDLNGSYDKATRLLTVIAPSGTLDLTTLRCNYETALESVLASDPAFDGISGIPADGKLDHIHVDDVIVVHHTTEEGFNAGSSHNAGKPISSADVVDSTGTLVDSDHYTVSKSAGTIAMTNEGPYTAPYTAKWRIENMSKVKGISGNTLDLTAPLTHDFPVGTQVSAAAQTGDLQARVVRAFDVETWQDAFEDYTNTPAPASYDFVNYPVQLANADTVFSRVAIVFVSTAAFDCVIDGLGVIASGNVNTDFAPLNPATGEPYFTLEYEGWGGGWSVGNALRFDLEGADTCLAIIRTTNPGPEAEGTDRAKIQIRGDVA